MALSPAQLQRLRKAAQKTYQAAGDSGEVLTRIGEAEGVPLVTRLGGLADAVSGAALTTVSIASILTTGGGAALIGGGVGVVAGVTQAVEGIDILMGKVDDIETGTNTIIQQTGEGGTGECQFKNAPQTQLDEVHGDLTNIGGGTLNTGSAARSAASLLGDFLLINSASSAGHEDLKATAHELLTAANTAATNAAAAEAQAVSNATGLTSLGAVLDNLVLNLPDVLETGIDPVLSLIETAYQNVAIFPFSLEGREEYDAMFLAGRIEGGESSIFVSFEAEEGIWVPAVNPYLFTIQNASGDVFNLLQIAIDVLNTVNFRPGHTG